MKLKKESRKEDNNFGKIFKESLKNISCNTCNNDLGASMILNPSFNPRCEGEPKGVSLYKISCRNCRAETPYFSNSVQHAIAAWSSYQKQVQ